MVHFLLSVNALFTELCPWVFISVYSAFLNFIGSVQKNRGKRLEVTAWLADQRESRRQRIMTDIILAVRINESVVGRSKR